MTLRDDAILTKITCRAPNLRRHNRLETWGARSTDGAWVFERTEETGTPWFVTHQPTGFWTLFSSLQRARNYANRELGLRLVVGMIEAWNAALVHGTVDLNAA